MDAECDAPLVFDVAGPGRCRCDEARVLSWLGPGRVAQGGG